MSKVCQLVAIHELCAVLHQDNLFFLVLEGDKNGDAREDHRRASVCGKSAHGQLRGLCSQPGEDENDICTDGKGAGCEQKNHQWRTVVGHKGHHSHRQRHCNRSQVRLEQALECRWYIALLPAEVRN